MVSAFLATKENGEVLLSKRLRNQLCYFRSKNLSYIAKPSLIFLGRKDEMGVEREGVWTVISDQQKKQSRGDNLNIFLSQKCVDI